MKYLIILAVVIGSALGNGYFEPQEGKDHQCCMCGDPLFRSFDGAYMVVKNATKYLMARCDDGSRDPCKIQVRCVTANSIYNQQGVAVPPWVDWCGIGYHQHKADDKYQGNWVVGQSIQYIGERGQASGFFAVDLNAGTRYFPSDGCNGADVASWHPNTPAPACCPHMYKIYNDLANNVIRFRSACCGWAVDFYPNGLDTCVVISAEKGHANVMRCMGQMEGLCGTMDGNPDTDWRLCPNGAAVPVNTAASMAAIDKSCEDGDHDGQGYTGGTKLDNIIDALG